MQDRTAIFNERIKLGAGFVNAIALGLVGFAVLRPLTENPAAIEASGLRWGVAGLALHGLGHYILGKLRGVA